MLCVCLPNIHGILDIHNVMTFLKGILFACEVRDIFSYKCPNQPIDLATKWDLRCMWNSDVVVGLAAVGAVPPPTSCLTQPPQMNPFSFLRSQPWKIIAHRRIFFTSNLLSVEACISVACSFSKHIIYAHRTSNYQNEVILNLLLPWKLTWLDHAGLNLTELLWKIHMLSWFCLQVN